MVSIRRRDDGHVDLDLGLDEVAYLKTLPDRLRQVLQDPRGHAAVTGRLFPPAYHDARQQAEYQRLLGEDLVRRKLDCIRVFETTLEQARVDQARARIHLSPEHFEFWLGFVNDFRLVLGAVLHIDNDNWSQEFDPGHPQAGDLMTYQLFTWLEGELLNASGFDLSWVKPDEVGSEPEEPESEPPDDAA